MSEKRRIKSFEDFMAERAAQQESSRKDPSREEPSRIGSSWSTETPASDSPAPEAPPGVPGEAPAAQTPWADLPPSPSPSGSFFSGLSTAAAGDMPTIVLAQVGLTVLDGIIIFVYLVMSMIDIGWLAVGLRMFAIPAMVLSIAPMVLGAIIMRQATKTGVEPPGFIWSRIGTYVGVMLALGTLFVPAVVAMQEMLSPSALPLVQ
ncbi:MAG: hypothetical protein V3U28_01325 [Candidatus Acidoferrales bacterium]